MLVAKSHLNRNTDSHAAGQQAAAAIAAHFGSSPVQCVLVYATQNHDQSELLAALRNGLGDVPLIGCSAQGVMGRGEVWEAGFAVGVLALGGDDIEVATAHARDIADDTALKGTRMGEQLVAGLSSPPKAAVLIYDPLAGSDAEALMNGLRSAVQCPITGGAASQPWGPMTQTFQYVGGDVFSHGAVALALTGDVEVLTDSSTGVSPTGLSMTVTRANGHHLLELDGKRAIDVWREMTGTASSNNIDDVAAWALGLEVQATQGVDQVTRAAFGFDDASGAVILQAPIPEGRQIMFQHRTAAAVIEGTTQMAKRLRDRCTTSVRVVLGFECGGRTQPFLGLDETRRENDVLQATLAPDAEWLGLMAWGEIVDVNASAQLCNYTFPVLLLADAA